MLHRSCVYSDLSAFRNVILFWKKTYRVTKLDDEIFYDVFSLFDAISACDKWNDCRTGTETDTFSSQVFDPQ